MSAENTTPPIVLVRPARGLSPAGTERDRNHHWVFLLLSIAVLAASAVLSVRGEKQVVVPLVGAALPGVCMWHRTFGLDCPGCGLTRCFISMAHGDLGRAWHFNPAGILLFGMLLAQLPYRAVQIWRIRRGRRPWELHRLAGYLFLIFVVALLAQWVVKLGRGLGWFCTF